MILRLVIYACLAALVAGCASQGAPTVTPKEIAQEEQYVSIVNSLTWTNPMTGKRDGLRSSWPLKGLKGQDEQFPLAQVRECNPAGACTWGVMLAHRKLNEFTYVDGGVTVDLTLGLNIDRRQEVKRPDYQAAMAIPSDVAVIRVVRELVRKLDLKYGKVQHVDADYGVRLDVCVLRYDAAGQALDVCDIPYI